RLLDRAARPRLLGGVVGEGLARALVARGSVAVGTTGDVDAGREARRLDRLGEERGPDLLLRRRRADVVRVGAAEAGVVPRGGTGHEGPAVAEATRSRRAVPDAARVRRRGAVRLVG